MGHSYGGAKRADVRPEGRQLRLAREEGRIWWIGMPGMMWQKVVPEVHRFARLDQPPDVLVLHVGGNDLSIRPMRQVIKDIKWDFLRLMTSFPKMIIVWSDIVARLEWRGARSIEKINKTRIKVNKEVGRFIARNGGKTFGVRGGYLEVLAGGWGTSQPSGD